MYCLSLHPFILFPSSSHPLPYFIHPINLTPIFPAPFPLPPFHFSASFPFLCLLSISLCFLCIACFIQPYSSLLLLFPSFLPPSSTPGPLSRSSLTTPALHPPYTLTLPSLHPHYTLPTPSPHPPYTHSTPFLHPHHTLSTHPIYPFSTLPSSTHL